MKIGILGCGYAGQAIGLFMKEQGYSIAGSTRNPQRLQELKSIFPEVHLINRPEALAFFLKTLNVLIICVAPTLSDNYQSTYLELANNIGKIAPQCELLQQIIYTSSTSVYGECGGEWVNEKDETHPLNENSEILLETERCYFNLSAIGVNVCIFRLGEIYGPDRQIEDRLKNNRGKKFPGDGRSYTNLIHIDDIVKAIPFAIAHHLNGIFNLCNDYHVTRQAFYDFLCKKHHLPLVEWDNRIKGLHGGNKRVDNKKIKDLGFSFAPCFF